MLLISKFSVVAMKQPNASGAGSAITDVSAPLRDEL